MSPDRIVLNHLLEGRQALVAEVERLTAAIRDLDAVIDRVSDTGGSRASVGDLEPVSARTIRSARSHNGRKPAGRRSTSRRSATVGGGDGQKSIRVHVLEMLESENRDFGLAEIIDRIHDAGIDAHDDAVRSITIKLMKDGRVERVGRGQYRLAGHAGGERSETPAMNAPAVDEPGSPDAQEEAEPAALNLAHAWDAPQA